MTEDHDQTETDDSGTAPEQHTPERDVDLIGTPFRVIATSAEIGRQLATTVVSRSWNVTRQVLEGARDGRSPAELANLVIEDTAATVRDTVGYAAQATPGGEPVLHATQAMTNQLPSVVRSRIAPLYPVSEAERISSTRRELRAAGRELLHRSAALDDDGEHPSFRAILRQLAPDEARILRLLSTAGAQPIMNVVEYNGLTRTSVEVSRNVSLVGSEAGCLHPDLTPVYLDNLRRLGLIHLRDYRIGPQEQYELLEAQPGVDGLPPPTGLFAKHRLQPGGVEISGFGRKLYEMCFAEDTDD